MKECPHCKMIVDADYTCPMCDTDLFDVPESESDRQRWRFSRYLLRFLLKRFRWPLLCTAALVAAVLLAMLSGNVHMPFTLLNVLTVLVVYIVFWRKDKPPCEWLLWKYNEEYLENRAMIGRWGTVILSFFLSLVLPFV